MGTASNTFLAAILALVHLGVGLVDQQPPPVAPPVINTRSTSETDDPSDTEVAWLLDEPDARAHYVGGIAARLHTAEGAPVPGDVFLLMATKGSDAVALVFDETPYTHPYGTHENTAASNTSAAELASLLAGTGVERLELTTPPGGGSSVGLAYAIGYLNVLSDGAFTGDLQVAATGSLIPRGYIGVIDSIDEKTAAAHLVGADVFFCPVAPGDEHVEAYGARFVGELSREQRTGATLAEERRLRNYRAWGAEPPAEMDIVGVRHIADVAAYLCGAGSAEACDLSDQLAGSVTTAPWNGQRRDGSHPTVDGRAPTAEASSTRLYQAREEIAA